MGMIYRRGNVWWLKYYRDGKPYRESSRSTKEADAKRLLKRREGEISEGKLPGIYFDRVRFDELAEDFLRDYRLNDRKSLERAAISLMHLSGAFQGMRVTEITTPRIERYIEERRKRTCGECQEKIDDGESCPKCGSGNLKPGAKNGTINRELAALKRILNLGAQRTPPKVDRVPYIPMLKENNVRKGFFEHEDFLALRDSLRDDAKHYFSTNRIQWWKGSASDPTGHLLSSQVACLNHLYLLRQRKDIATTVLKTIEPTVQEAVPVNTGYVEFEYIRTRQYLKEKAFARGANCTSVDAVMLGSNADKKRVLFLLEWKYTEYYATEDLYIPRRSGVYDPLITSIEGPFVPNVDPRSLYFEPFYQMMRQTLLAWQFEKHGELDCSRCVNVHIIPKQNRELKETITAQGLSGRNIHDAWKKLLKTPAKYISCDPCELLKDARDLPDTKSWLYYLKARYW